MLWSIFEAAHLHHHTLPDIITVETQKVIESAFGYICADRQDGQDGKSDMQQLRDLSTKPQTHGGPPKGQNRQKEKKEEMGKKKSLKTHIWSHPRTLRTAKMQVSLAAAAPKS